MKRKLCLFLCALLAALSFSACQRSVSSLKLIRYDLSGPVLSLDPLFARDTASRLVIANIGEGLLARGKNFELEPGVAEDWSISADGRTLTFSLRADAFWSDGAPVTSGDFVYAFRRMFNPGTPSVYAQDYIAIENAREVLDRSAAPETLGVAARGEKELEIRLAHPSPFFPALLAETPAMPCNEEFFVASRGRYGLDAAYVASNGPFTLEKWDNESVTSLRPNENYARGIPSVGVNLYASGEDSFARMQSGAIDCAVIPATDAAKLSQQDLKITAFDATTWCIVFNQNSDIWGNPLLRQGIAHATDHSTLRESLPETLAPTALFLPAAATLAGEQYRAASSAQAVAFDPERARSLFDMGLAALPLNALPQTNLYAPESAGHLLAMGTVLQGWQKHLLAYVNIESATDEGLAKRLATGDYDMLLLPFSLAAAPAAEMLGIFRSGAAENQFGYHNPLYDGILAEISGAPDFLQAADFVSRAESMLLQDAVIIPVYTEPVYFAAGANAQQMPATPFESQIYFKYA